MIAWLYGKDKPFNVGRADVPGRPRIIKYQDKLYVQLPGSLDGYIDATGEIVTVEHLEGETPKRKLTADEELAS